MNRHPRAISLASVLLLVPAGPALAQFNDILQGALEGVINSTIQNELENTQPRSATNTATSTREENRQIQQALNHFGHPAGTADGILGRRSRAAITQYQNSKGYHATGTLTNAQKSELLSNWRWSTSGAATSSTDVLGVIGAGQLILDNGSIRRDRKRRESVATTTTRTGATGEIILTDPDQTSNRTRKRTRINSDPDTRTVTTTSEPPIVRNVPSNGSATSRRSGRQSTTTTTPTTTTSKTTTTTRQSAGTRTGTTGSTDSTSTNAARQLRCQLRGTDPSLCQTGN